MSALNKEQNFIEIEVEGKTYKLGKLNVGDIIDVSSIMTERLRNRRIELLKSLYKDEIPDSQIDGIISINFDFEDLEKHLEAVGLILWRALQRYQPSISEKDAMNLITVENCETIINKLMPKGSGSRSKKKPKEE